MPLFPSRSLLLASIALCFAAPASASTDYYVVVPMPGKVAAAPAQNLTVTLNAFTLPAGEVNVAYDFNLNAALQVTGDSAFSPGQVAWSLGSGALPQGIELEADGRLAGVPVAETAPEGASFEVVASYKGADCAVKHKVARNKA